MRKLWIILRDWWRGYTNEELASALSKMQAGTTGLIRLSHGEVKAWHAFMRDLS